MSLVSKLRKRSRDNILFFADALALAEECGVNLALVEQAALENDIWPETYLRHRGVFTSIEQHRLLGSTVALIGCGGLGGQIFEELVRLGVGRIIVLDPDRFAAHNLNRQLLCTAPELGLLKVEAAVRRAKAVNPAVTVIPLARKFSQNINGEVRQAQVILDALDSVTDRLELADFCHTAGIPLVHGAVNGWYGQIGVQKETLLLKKIYLHPPENIKEKPLAVICCTVAAVASLQVAETVKLLLRLDSELTDRWKSIDLRSCEIEQL
ncbi:MAG: HesA/MoeB/ThiF family protein [Desulfobulbaceae bacterium]|nr:HesA/MoeB/ThiF family protein [Desulfobulbaceae bacterium]